MPRSMRPVGSLLAVALLLAACGGAAAPDATTAPDPTAIAPTEAPAEAPATDAPAEVPAAPGTELSACEIITPADIEAAAGATGVEPGELKAKPTTLSPGRTECTYQGDWGRLIVELTPEDGANLFDAARGSYDDASDITGVGDGAFNSDANKRAFVVKGPVAVMFTMYVNGVERYDLAEALGKAVVAKL